MTPAEMTRRDRETVGLGCLVALLFAVLAALCLYACPPEMAP